MFSKFVIFLFVNLKKQVHELFEKSMVTGQMVSWAAFRLARVSANNLNGRCKLCIGGLATGSSYWTRTPTHTQTAIGLAHLKAPS